MTSEGTRSGIPHFFLNVLRIATGILFWQHGAQKMLGWLDGRGPMEFGTLIWLAGVLEFFGGILIALGLLTRPVAVVLALEMAVAYFRSHLPRGVWPILSGGELAAMYFFVYAFLAANGGGRFSLDGLLEARRADRQPG